MYCPTIGHVETRHWKKETSWTPRSSTFFLFPSKFSKFSAKYGFLNEQIRNHFKIVIFIACKWCKICKHYVNSMLISYSTCKNGIKWCISIKYLTYAVFKICRNLCVFSAKYVFPKFQSTQYGFFQVWLKKQCFTTGQWDKAQSDHWTVEHSAYQPSDSLTQHWLTMGQFDRDSSELLIVGKAQADQSTVGHLAHQPLESWTQHWPTNRLWDTELSNHLLKRQVYSDIINQRRFLSLR